MVMKPGNLADQLVEKAKELRKLEALNAVLSDAVKKAEAVAKEKGKNEKSA